MHSVERTLGNIPLWVDGTIVAYLDDLDVVLLLDSRGELAGVRAADREDSQREPAVITASTTDVNGLAIWWAASLEMIEQGDAIREAADVPAPKIQTPSAPIYGVGFKGGRFAG